MRLKGMCLLNFPKLGETALNLAKKVMKPKLFERVSFDFFKDFW